MKFCKRCGGAIDDKLHRCTSCGHQYFHFGRLAAATLAAFLIVVAGFCLLLFSYSSRLDASIAQNSALSSKNAELVAAYNGAGDSHRAELSEMQAQIDQANASNSEVLNSLRSKDKEIEALQAEVETLTAKVASRDATIESNRKAAAELSERVSDYDALLSEYNKVHSLLYTKIYFVYSSDDTFYHHYNCPGTTWDMYNAIQTGVGFLGCPREDAIDAGYIACPKCVQ